MTSRIHVATYQTLDVDTDEATANFLTKHYPENYFTHIVIDECHRSAWGKWSQVLTRNAKAVQVGLTATPRQLEPSEKTKEAQEDAQITADNIKHFGEPVYEYDYSPYKSLCHPLQNKTASPRSWPSRWPLWTAPVLPPKRSLRPRKLWVMLISVLPSKGLPRFL